MFRLSRCSSITTSRFISKQFSRTVTKQTSTVHSIYDDDESNVPSLITQPYKWLEYNHGAKAVQASSPEYNRWKQVAPPVATMLCLGGMYAWSLFNGPLTHEIGVITSVASDWSLTSVVPVFSTLVFMNGFAGAVLGKWIDRVGPRMAYGAGGLCYGGGMMLGSLGVTLHSLPLLYGGYGVIAGLGHGICYISCISTLIKFFPDRAGLAAGMSLMGLGGGAILATPAIDRLLTKNFNPPTHVDDNILASIPNAVSLNDKGQSFLDVSQITSMDTSTVVSGDNLAQIARLDVNDLLSSGFSSKIMSTLIDGGTYLVGSGSTGAAGTMFTVGAVYFTTILASALFTKLPNPQFNPLKKDEDDYITNDKQDKAAVQPYSMTVEDVFRTPQFWCMWLALFSLSTTGMGCISTAKTMMSEVFGGSLPLIVTASFSSTYVMSISASNLAGRLGWGFISDKIGPYNTYGLMAITGCMLYGLVPYYVASVVDTPSTIPLVLFYGSTLFCFSYFGGGFSVMPAYETKLFGAKNVGAIHGRMMTAVALSGFAGPFIVTQCRERTRKSSIYELVDKVDPQLFQDTFGASVNDIDSLIQSKAVTINKLLQLIPDNMDVIDPTPFLYDSTMYTMSGALALCATANILLKRFGIPTQMLKHQPNTKF